MASLPGLTFKILRVWMRLCVYVCVNDEFCADEEEDSECREVRENRVSFEQSERRQSVESCEREREREREREKRVS